MKKCPSCGVSSAKPRWVVGSTGPHSWRADFDQQCDSCWSKSVRGDGHSYSGSFATEEEAVEHAIYLFSNR